jgi:hypothetical protein
MKRGFGGRRRVLIASVAIAMIGTAAAAAAVRPLLALARLEPGLWQVRDLEDTSARPISVCVGDPTVLLQLEHKQTACSRIVITNEANVATVHYTCPANGFGRTSLTVETPRLAKIDTQGIVGNAPFAFTAEARRVGSCQSASRR